ncbi:MAG: hypothetical protein WKF37_09800 [Bryobacteraceae bacterium]
MNNTPTVRIAGTGDLLTNASQSITNNTTYDNGLTGTKLVGRHTLRFGGQYRRYYDNVPQRRRDL